MGLYTLPVDKVAVFVIRTLPAETLKLLASCFFPGLGSREVLSLARSTCPWQAGLDVSAYSCLSSLNEIEANREEIKIHLPPYVIMPYNFLDNFHASDAIGTSVKTLKDAAFCKLDETWPMWSTTSRSCIVRPTPVQANPGPPMPHPDWKWPQLKREARSALDLKEVVGKQPLSVAEFGGCFSMKLGVEWVGSLAMYGKKDTVASDLQFGTLESDYIAVMNQKKGHDNATDPHFKIMLEIFGIGAKEQGGKGYGDGVVIRDLSCLDRNKIYLPMVSIPFVTKRLRALKGRFAGLSSKAWREHWAVHFAKNLGRAKAILLMRYGMQMETPNSQNFLIELERGSQLGAEPKPTGCIVLRDLGDAHLVKDVVWALHADMVKCSAKDEIDAHIIDAAVKLMYPTLKRHIVETVALKWFEYSCPTSAKNLGGKSQLSTDPDAGTGDWETELYVMAQWGLMHARGFIECALEHLAPNPYYDFATELAAFPNPEQFLELKKLRSQPDSNQQQRFDAAKVIFDKFMDWEKTLGDALMARIFKNHTVLNSLRNWDWQVRESKPSTELEKKEPKNEKTAPNTSPKDEKGPLDFEQDWG